MIFDSMFLHITYISKFYNLLNTNAFHTFLIEALKNQDLQNLHHIYSMSRPHLLLPASKSDFKTPEIKILSVALLSQAKKKELDCIAGDHFLNKHHVRITARNQSLN